MTLTDARNEMMLALCHINPENPTLRKAAEGLVANLLAAHLAELAGEHDAVEAAAKAMYDTDYNEPEDDWEACNAPIRARYLRNARAAAPLLRAPLVAENQQLRDRVKTLEATTATAFREGGKEWERRFRYKHGYTTILSATDQADAERVAAIMREDKRNSIVEVCYGGINSDDPEIGSMEWSVQVKFWDNADAPSVEAP